ncbi:hypothetical protein IC229_20325 [Spirosoma sp. BT702]|uniref:Uncharacterized protein n=1 Tax=Spirosoma profusum TaxID=2771354 RepID=A0A927AP08_9BACT|nr:hypothetical protein [Spirosoma profusum]MBD2703004.1 hypothetical protein [Spirosoma profusum]
MGGPFLLSLSDGRLVVSSNSSHISVSSNYGQSWQRVADAWPKSLGVVCINPRRIKSSPSIQWNVPLVGITFKFGLGNLMR